jgi:hypothetical protein
MAEKFTQGRNIYNPNDKLKSWQPLREILRAYKEECAEIDKAQPLFNQGLDEVCACDGAIERLLELLQTPAMYEALKEISELAPRDKLRLPYAHQVVEIVDKALALVGGKE